MAEETEETTRAPLSDDQVREIAEISDDVAQASEEALQKAAQCAPNALAAMNELQDAINKLANPYVAGSETTTGTSTQTQLTLYGIKEYMTGENPFWGLYGSRASTEAEQERSTGEAMYIKPYYEVIDSLVAIFSDTPLPTDTGTGHGAAWNTHLITEADVEQVLGYIANPGAEEYNTGDRPVTATNLEVVKKSRPAIIRAFENLPVEPYFGELQSLISRMGEWDADSDFNLDATAAGMGGYNVSMILDAYATFAEVETQLSTALEGIVEALQCIRDAISDYERKQQEGLAKIIGLAGAVQTKCAETGVDDAAGTAYNVFQKLGAFMAEGASAGCAGVHALDFPNLSEEDKKRVMDAIAAIRQPPTQQFAGNKQRILFQEQCFLLAYINELSAWKKENLDADSPRGTDPASQFPLKRLPYIATRNNPDKTIGNASLLVDGDPYAFLNVLTLDPTMSTFFDISSSELSHLQPMIRLYKINRNEQGEESQQEIKFESNAGSIWPEALQDALHNKTKRGFGVGLKDFSFTYDGSNPFAIKKSIKAKLKIFANSFDELLTDRGGWKYADLALKTGGTNTEECQSGTQQAILNAKENENLSKLNFRLKAVVGWAEPKGANVSNLAVKDALYNSFVTLNLTPTVHHFELDEMGRVNFTINYLAYIEDYFDDKQAFNIFASANMATATGKVTVTEAQIRRKLQLEYFTKNCRENETAIANLKEGHLNEIEEERRVSLQSLIKSLTGGTCPASQSHIYYISMPYEEIQAFQSKGPFHTPSTQNIKPVSNSENNERLEASIAGAMDTLAGTATGGAISEETGATFAAALFVDNPEQYSLGFFYISDLIDTILWNIGGELEILPREIANLSTTTDKVDICDKYIEVARLLNQQKAFKKLRILLGPVEFVDHGRKPTDPLFVNFGDIPISVKYFTEWLTNKMLKKQESNYSLTKFLNDLFNDLVNEFLNNETCFKFDIKQKVMINQAVVTSYPSPWRPDGILIDEITYAIKAKHRSAPGQRARLDWWHNATEAPFAGAILNISGDRESPSPSGDVSGEMNYFIYFAGRTQPVDRMRGIRATDHSRGIFHYLLGRDRGLIKNISLTKTDSKGLAEVRFEQDGYDGLKQLRVIYDAQIDCFASPKTFPGCYIFIDPKGFAPGTTHDRGTFDLTQYGIGGYYMIYKSEHMFGAGKADTRIYAKWVAELNPDHAKDEESDARASVVNNNDFTKCTTYGSARRTSAGRSDPPPAAALAPTEASDDVGRSATDG
tara:strand:- start:1539 stop:5309 length:3771 start_codon:yes stop_codon:yes gene_type:complete